jgi:hypothetical protein
MGGTSTLSAGGALSYTWLPIASNATNVVVSPSVSTCYTLVGALASGCQTSTVVCVNMTSNPTLSATGNTVICAGSSTTLNLNGAVSYSFFPTTGVLPNGVFNPSVSTCYTIGGTNATGCFGYTIACIQVNGNPTLTVNSPNMCAGTSATLVGNGATTYTWLPTLILGATNIVSPASSTCYTLIGTNLSACTSTVLACVNVVPLPTLTIASSATAICMGDNTNLSASGAQTYTWLPGNLNFPIITVSPAAPTCYTVLGTAGACTNSAVQCINVNAASSFSIAGPGTVCIGTSATFTASGANSYTWSIFNATTPTVWITPSVTSVYTATGSTSNGCTGTQQYTIVVNMTCADVWPGDANSDGTVSSLDVLELGLQANATGAPRSPGGNAYTAQYANNWTGTISSGKNKCHADCNGDGTINANDTLAIYNNFSLNHSFRPSPSASGDVNLVKSNATFMPGRWNTIDVVYGDVSNVQNQVYGLTFDISYDGSIVENDSIYLVYTSSFLNAGNQNIQFRKPIAANDRIYAATVRTNGSNVSGQGKIAELRFKASASSTNNLQLSVSNVNRISANGSLQSLTGSNQSLAMTGNLTGITSVDGALQAHVVPNPSAGIFTIHLENNTTANYQVIDINGRLVQSGVISSLINSVDLSQMPVGVYYLQLTSNQQTSCTKLVLVK